MNNHQAGVKLDHNKTRPRPRLLPKRRQTLRAKVVHYASQQERKRKKIQKTTNYFSSPTWLSSFSAAILKLGSIVPFRAWIIRLGSMSAEFHGSFCVLVSHICTVSLRFCFIFGRTLWVCLNCGPKCQISQIYNKNFRLVYSTEIAHWREQIDWNVHSEGKTSLPSVKHWLAWRRMGAALPRITGNQLMVDVKHSKVNLRFSSSSVSTVVRCKFCCHPVDQPRYCRSATT